MKLIYDSIEQVLRPWPSSTDEVTSLEPHLWPMDVIEQPKPVLSVGQAARHTETVNTDTRQVIRGWEVVTIPPQWPNAQAFMAAFTDAEKAQIALSTDPTIAGMRLTLSTWLSAMETDDSRVQAGLNKLIDLGILTEQRKTEIIATATAS